MMALKALLFDVDGTLADTEETHRQAFNYALVEFGLKWEWAEAQSGGPWLALRELALRQTVRVR
jgi:beta-phosphoglucomutase-like phosphatase (HAD superfamily)